MDILNIKQKEGLGFQECTGNVTRIATGPMSVGPRARYPRHFLAISKQNWGLEQGPAAKSTRCLPFVSQVEKPQLSIADLMQAIVGSAARLGHKHLFYPQYSML